MTSNEAISRLLSYSHGRTVGAGHDWSGCGKVPLGVHGNEVALLKYLDENPDLELMDSYWLLPNGAVIKVETGAFAMAHWESAAHALGREAKTADELEAAFLDFKELTGAAHMTYFIAGGEPMADFPSVPTMQQIMSLSEAEAKIGSAVMWTVSRRDKTVVASGCGAGELLMADPAQMRRGLSGARVSPLLAFR